ncbi:Uncharacterized protein PBTT_01181 [Plasmodiophora brassicae]|uniref:Uncharacterized protein n=1 Tax=Plasmodiophora brassicae TaxID=37360 RepID=A0A0G4IZ10_PLABS|nr:hypothetical protein PBRA_001614 [Plasmodiophora brassicae]
MMRALPVLRVVASRGRRSLAVVPESLEPVNLDFCNIMEGKEAAKAPESYPDWLWGLTDPAPTLLDLKKIPAEQLSAKQKRRLFKLYRSNKIKNANAVEGI